MIAADDRYPSSSSSSIKKRRRGRRERRGNEEERKADASARMGKRAIAVYGILNKKSYRSAAKLDTVTTRHSR